MLIRYKNVTDGNIQNPLRYGDGDDEHIAVCSMYALKLYSQRFMEDPQSKHHSLIDDVMDTGSAGDTAFSAILGIDWDADARATWAMLRAGDVGGLNGGVDQIPDYDEFIESHAADTIDFWEMHACVNKEVDSTFRSLSTRLAEERAESEE